MAKTIYLRRTGIPRGGMISPRMARSEIETKFCLFLAVWGAVAVAGALLFQFIRSLLSPTAVIWLGAMATVVWFGILLWRAHQADRLRLRRDRERMAVAVKEWDANAGNAPSSP